MPYLFKKTQTSTFMTTANASRAAELFLTLPKYCKLFIHFSIFKMRTDSNEKKLFRHDKCLEIVNIQEKLQILKNNFQKRSIEKNDFIPKDIFDGHNDYFNYIYKKYHLGLHMPMNMSY